MKVVNLKKIILINMFSLFSFIFLSGDAPFESYHVAYKDISKGAIINTYGILTLSSRPNKGTELKTYTKTQDRFKYDKTLNVSKIIPISNFGYHPPDKDIKIAGYRLPVVDRDGKYLCIVYDPIKNLRTWINLKEEQENFCISIVPLDSMKKASSSFVDIFYFTRSRKRKVYKEPRKDAAFKIISGSQHYLLQIIDQKDGFVKVANLRINYDTGKETLEPIGWIRIRDDKGQLMIWIVDVDLC